MFNNALLSQLPTDVWEALTTGSGIVLSTFSPTQELAEQNLQQNILFATDGGVTLTLNTTYRDHASGLDNAPTDTKQLADIESVEATMGGTAKTFSKTNIPYFLPHSNVSELENGVTEISIRRKIEAEDFKSCWLVAPYGTKGGFVAAHLKDCLNTGGFSWQTANNDKSSFPFTFKGFSDLESPEEVPLKIYVKSASGVDTQEVE